MAISIKNPENDRWARQVAEKTGESLTAAIKKSLRERLDRLGAHAQAPDLLEDLLTIAKRCAALPELDSRSAHEIIGYDERGAPQRRMR